MTTETAKPISEILAQAPDSTHEEVQSAAQAVREEAKPEGPSNERVFESLPTMYPVEKTEILNIPWAQIPEFPGYSLWAEDGHYFRAKTVPEDRFGPHAYFSEEAKKWPGTHDCPCGCWMGSSRSGGPVDPFGPCPKNPKNKASDSPDVSVYEDCSQEPCICGPIAAEPEPFVTAEELMSSDAHDADWLNARAVTPPKTSPTKRP